MEFEIIDFHTHPYTSYGNNICGHKDIIKMDSDYTLNLLKDLGISKFCGSVVEKDPQNTMTPIEKMLKCNNTALELREYYKGCYIPGFHIHPDYVEESINEIHRMHNEGVKLIGELVPSYFGWDDYSADGLSQILSEAGRYNMVVSFHTIAEYGDRIDKMVKSHPDVIFVAAHPGELPTLTDHIERAKKFDNYYLDVSGTGLFRYGMIRRALDAFGSDRILFGSDFPTCNPAMFVGGVLLDSLITDSEKEKIFSLNAKRILNL